MRVQTLLLVCALATSVVHSTVLENGLASFRLSDKNGALLEILNKETGRKVFLGQEQTATPWKILLLDNQNGVPVPRNLRATTAPEVSLRREGPAQILTLNWREDDKRCIVTATATLPDDSGVATWRLAVKTVGNASCAAPWVKELRFPCLDDIASLGEDRLIYGHFIGRQVRRPGSRLSPVKISSPGEWSMQFCAFHGTARAGTDTSAPNMLDGFHRPPMPDETGLLVAAADGDGHFKELRINRAGDERFSLNITHFPQWPFWPMDKGKALSCFDYRMPYAVHLGVFSGGQGKAVELYREIALNYPTVRKAGPLRAPNNPVSAKMKENVFWGKLYYGANHIVPGALELKKYLRVPMSIHWYKYGAHQFDDDNIDYFPLLGQFREGVQTLRQADVSVAPYVCCGVLDPDTENYRRHGMDKAIILNESMTPDIWTLCNQSSYFANPASPLWRRAYREVTSRLMGQWATDGQYLDVMAGIGGLDYAGCDNAPHGGNYWTQGNRTLLRELHEAGRKATPDPFLVTECFNEHYVGCADGFLMLDLTRYGWAFSLVHEVIPLLSHVYHDYALFYGSDCNQKVPLDQFRWNMGLSFAWGIQLCYSTRSFETPGNCPHDHFTRDLSQAWYRVGNKFLNGGRNLEMALLPAGHASGHIPALLSAPHTVNIKFDNGTRIWRGPAVVGSLWQAEDNSLGIVMANLTGEHQTARILLEADTLPANRCGDFIWRTWPLPVAPMGRISNDTSLELCLPPDKGFILEVRDNIPPSPRELPNYENCNFIANQVGEFPPLACKDDRIYGCEDAWLRHQDGVLTLLEDDRQTLLHAIPFQWLGMEGRGGPRNRLNRTFHLARPSGCRLQAQNPSVTAQLHQDVLTAQIRLATKGTILSDDQPACLLAVDTQGEILFAEEGRISLPPGDYRVISYRADEAWMAEYDQRTPWRGLSAISTHAIRDGKALLTGDDTLFQPDRRRGERMLALGNAIAWLATGKTATPQFQQDILLLAHPEKMTFLPEGGELRLLNLQQRGNVSLIPNDGFFEVTVHGLGAAGTLVRLLYEVTVPAKGQGFVLTHLMYMEAMEGILPEIDWQQDETVLGDRESELAVKMTVTNVSPVVLPIRVSATDLPPGWSLSKVDMGKENLVQPQERRLVQMLFRHDGNTPKATSQRFEVGVNYTDSPVTLLHESFILHNRNTMVAPGNTESRVSEGGWTGGTRGENLVAFPAMPKSRRVTLDFTPNTNGVPFTPSIDFTMLDENLREIRREKINLSKETSSSVSFELPAEKRLFARINGRFYHMRVNAPHYGYSAWRHTPFHLFGKQETTFHFLVNHGARHFVLGCQDGGTMEIAKIMVRDSDGKVAFSHEGNAKQARFRIPVPKGMDGRDWSVTVEPVEDFFIWLEDGASPWLSLERQSIICEELVK